MTVHKTMRETSSMQFLETARNIHIRVTKLCLKAPKRWSFYISRDMYQSSYRLFSLLKAGNSVYPSDRVSCTLRRGYMLRAKASLEVLIGNVSLFTQYVKESGNLKDYSGLLKEISSLMIEENKLLNGVIKSDRDKIKHVLSNLEDSISDEESINKLIDSFNSEIDKLDNDMFIPDLSESSLTDSDSMRKILSDLEIG